MTLLWFLFQGSMFFLAGFLTCVAARKRLLDASHSSGVRDGLAVAATIAGWTAHTREMEAELQPDPEIRALAHHASHAVREVEWTIRSQKASV